MRRALSPLILTALLAGSNGCSTACPTGKLSELLQQNPKPTAALAALATEAQADAVKQSDPRNKVSCYRVAAVAAWQSERDDAPVNTITTAGGDACDALPRHDADAPTDCTAIRVAAPMATQDAIGRQLQSFAAQLTTPAAKLPGADFAKLQTAFDGLASQYDQVSDIRQRADGLAVPAEVKTRLERYRLIITCNAISAWTFSGRCADAPIPAFTAMAQEKQRMITGLGMTTAQVTQACTTSPGSAPPIE